MQSIEWRDIQGFSGRYQVSNDGQVRIASTGHIMRQAKRPSGHPCITLVTTGGRGGRRPFNVHVLVAHAFLGVPTGPFVRHLNDVPSDNRVENLAYGTRSDNRRDAVRNGLDHNRRKTHCPHGHEYTPENTYVERGRGGRQCRACGRDRATRNRRRNRPEQGES